MRPSAKEINKKIREARAAIAEGRVAIFHQDVIAMDALELGYLIESELPDVLLQLFYEISPAHYAGTRPPQRSYEKDIRELADVKIP